MPPRTSTSQRTHFEKSTLSYISITPDIRLYSEDHFIQSLRPLPFTRRSFRSFLRSLSVPMLHIGTHRYVDHLSLALALRAVLRVGSSDFYAPGSPRPTGVPPSHLDPESFRTSLTTTIAELLASRHYSASEASDIVSAARDAASRMLLAGFQALPLEAQKEYTRRALRKYFKPTPSDDNPTPQPAP